MSKIFTDKERLKIDLPEHTGKPGILLKRYIMFGFLAFSFLAILFSYLIYQRYLIIKQAQKKEALHVANNAKDRLQEALKNSLSATKILAFFIDNNGVVKHFDSVAAQILSTNKNIDVVQLVPAGVIQHVYPLKGNESVIGYNILKDSTRNKEAFKAIQKKELFFSGPFLLKQGGFGIVGRLPVFRNGKFWGFSAVVIKMATLLKAAGLDRTGKDGYYYQLSKINVDAKKTEFFIPLVKERLKDYLISIDIPDGDWKLSVEPVEINKDRPEIYILALLGFLFSVLGGITVFIIVKRPEKLERLVKERTRAFKASENKYRSVVERVSDAFISLDNDWNYTYINKKAGEIFGRKPEKLIGKNIWVEFTEGIDTSFYHAYYRAMQTQQYQYLEEFYPQHEMWFESHIYPSKDGLTVFFSDVTEIKKASRGLKENEEKYRSFIEQASDGIVITDLDGYILEVNKSMALMSGYSMQQMPGKHIYEFLPDDDIVLNPLRFNELLEGKSLLYDRKLLRKDGSVLDIEVNSKMASTQTLIGFIRDITERKKYNNALLYQARLLESVSDAVTSLDINRCIVSWNSACDELYGFTAGEVMGKRIPQLVTFKYPDTTNEAVFKQVFSEGRWNGEFDFIHPKTKKIIHLLSNINLLKNNEGTVSGFIITSKNISDRKIAEGKIKISNERFALIGRATNDALWEWNLETNELWGNEVHQQLYGLTMSDPVPDDAEWIKRLHTEDRERMTEIVAAALASQNNSFEAEYRLYTANKGWANIYGITYIERNKEGKAIRLIGNMTDITERKKAEEKIYSSVQKYRLLFDNNPLPMWMTTIPGLDIMDVNESAIEHYGYSREEFLKLNAKDLWPAEDVAYFVNEVKKMKPGINNTRPWRHKKKDGTVIYVEIYSHEILYEGQRVWLELSHDVTEKHEAKELLQKSYEDIRQLASNLQSIREDERTNIAREIHDELGQQLTGLKMDLHWLTRKINSSDTEIAAKMKESIELINATITSVRKIATDLRPSILDDLGLLAALEWQSEEFEKRSGTKVKFISDAGDINIKPETATGIFRIYQELLTNIARHANASLVQAVLHKDEDKLYFSINDNGIGFDSGTIANKKTLGLLGIKERTLLLGGTYEIKSKPGEGSVTNITIPLIFVKSTI